MIYFKKKGFMGLQTGPESKKDLRLNSVKHKLMHAKEILMMKVLGLSSQMKKH